MEDLTKRLSRRSFLRALGAAGGTAIAGSVLAACGGGAATTPAATSAPAEAPAATAAPAAAAPTSAPAAEATAAPVAEATAAPPPKPPPRPPLPAAGAGEVSLLWSDTTNARAPLLEDFTKATGIKVNQTIVQYNERLNKINTAVKAAATLMWFRWTRSGRRSSPRPAGSTT